MSPAPPGRPRRRDETRPTGRTGRNDLTDEIFEIRRPARPELDDFGGHFGAVLGRKWPQHHPSNATFSTTPFSRHRGHEKSKNIGRFRVPKKQFFEDVFASCQASWSQRGRLEQLRKIMRICWFSRYATRVGHFRHARNKRNYKRKIGTKSEPKPVQQTAPATPRVSNEKTSKTHPQTGLKWVQRRPQRVCLSSFLPDRPQDHPRDAPEHPEERQKTRQEQRRPKGPPEASQRPKMA